MKIIWDPRIYNEKAGCSITLAPIGTGSAVTYIYVYLLIVLFFDELIACIDYDMIWLWVDKYVNE